MKYRLSLLLFLSLALTLAYACSSSTTLSPQKQIPAVAVPIQSNSYLLDEKTQAQNREASAKRRQVALDRLKNHGLPHLEKDSISDFSIQRWNQEQSVSYAGHLVYYENTFLADPFSYFSSNRITLSDNTEHYYVNAFQWTILNQKDNYQYSYEDHLDTLLSYEAPEETLELPDQTYWYQWPETESLEKWLDFSSAAQFFISSSPDAKKPIEVDGELRYKIYNSTKTKVFEGTIANKSQPEDLIVKHQIPLGKYYVQLYITKPSTGNSNILGVKTPLYHSIVRPLNREEWYVDMDLKTSRFISPNKTDDACPNGLGIQVNRALNVDTKYPLYAETMVFLYTYPDWDFIGELTNLSGVGSYEFTWDGKDHNGNPLPDGIYGVEVLLRNYRKAFGRDRGDWMVAHLVNNRLVAMV